MFKFLGGALLGCYLTESFNAQVVRRNRERIDFLFTLVSKYGANLTPEEVRKLRDLGIMA